MDFPWVSLPHHIMKLSLIVLICFIFTFTFICPLYLMAQDDSSSDVRSNFSNLKFEDAELETFIKYVAEKLNKKIYMIVQ